MYFTDWLRTVWANLNRMRGRVLLTAFGVVIGTMAVMVLVSLGAGLQRSATGSLGDIANLKRIDVSGPMMGPMAEPVDPSGKSAGSPSKKPPALTDAALAELRAIPGVAAVIPIEEPQNTGLTYKQGGGGAQIIGGTPEMLEQMGLKAEIGSTRLERGQMIIGPRVRENFWDSQGRSLKIESLMGETIAVEVFKPSPEGEGSTRSWRYEVTGVLKEGGESDYQVFIPVRDVQAINQWATGKRINRSQDGYNRVIVQAVDSKQVQEIQKAIQDKGFSAFSALDMVREINSFFGILQAILGGIGAIALLVAALGIVNTLSMAILERTREIGLMKAVGARESRRHGDLSGRGGEHRIPGRGDRRRSRLGAQQRGRRGDSQPGASKAATAAAVSWGRGTARSFTRPCGCPSLRSSSPPSSAWSAGSIRRCAPQRSIHCAR